MDIIGGGASALGTGLGWVTYIVLALEFWNLFPQTTELLTQIFKMKIALGNSLSLSLLL